MNEKFGLMFVSDAASLVKVPLAIYSKANAEYLATLSVTYGTGKKSVYSFTFYVGDTKAFRNSRWKWYCNGLTRIMNEWGLSCATHSSHPLL